MKRTQDRIRQDVFLAINRVRDKEVREYWCDKCNHRHKVNSKIGKLHKIDIKEKEKQNNG